MRKKSLPTMRRRSRRLASVSTAATEHPWLPSLRVRSHPRTGPFISREQADTARGAGPEGSEPAPTRVVDTTAAHPHLEPALTEPRRRPRPETRTDESDEG